MPRVILDRIVHFEYNYGKTLIDDLTWRSDGENMLNFMPNGGGKSVVNQMMSAMFLFGRDRNYIVNENNSAVTRRFSSFFKRGARPTYLIKELVKDNEAGRMLLVMCVRKSEPLLDTPASDQEADDEEGTQTADQDSLSITVWLEESEDSHAELSEALPLKDKNGRVWTEEQTASWFQERKKKGARIERFNLSSGSTGRRRYREALGRNGISLEEKKLMRPYAMQESGLSSFVGQNSTEEALMNQYIVPAASQRLEEIGGGEENQIAGIQKAIRSYCENHEQNEEDLMRYQECYEFQQFYNSLQTSADVLLSHQRTVARYEADLHNAAWRMLANEKETERTIKEWNALIEQLEAEHRNLQLLRISLDYYQAQKKTGACEELFHQAQKNLEALQKQVEALHHLVESIRYTKSLEEARRFERQAEELSMRLEAVESSVNELNQKIAATGYSLYVAFEKKIGELQTDLTTQQDSLAQAQDDLKQEKEWQKQLNKKLNANTSALARSDALLQTYDRFEKGLARYDIPVPGRLEPFQMENDILTGIQKAEKEEQAQEKECVRSLKQIEKLEKQRITLQKDERTLGDQRQAAQKEANRIERQKEDLEAVREAWLKTARKIADPEDVQAHFWDVQWLIEALKARIERARENQEQFRLMQQSAMSEKKMLSKESAALDPDALAVLEKCRITPLRGSSYLRENKTISLEQARDLCQTYPLFPFSLMMSAKERKTFLKQLEAEKIVTTSPIVLTDREAFAAMARQIGKDAPDYSYREHTIYAGFDPDVLDTARLQKRIQACDEKIASCTQNLRQIDQDMMEYSRDLGYQNDHATQSSKEYEQILRQWNEAREQLDRLDHRILSCREDQEAISSGLNQARKAEQQAQKTLTRKKERLEMYRQWHERYEEAAAAYHQQQTLRKEKADLEAQQEKAEQRREELEEQVLERKEQSTAIRRSLSEATKQKAVYEQYVPKTSASLPEVFNESIETLESRYKGLSANTAFAEKDRLKAEAQDATDRAAQKRAEAENRQKINSMSLEEVRLSLVEQELEKEHEWNEAVEQRTQATAASARAEKDWQNAQDKERDILETVRQTFHSEPAPAETIDTSLDYRKEIDQRQEQIGDARQALVLEQNRRDRQREALTRIAGFGGDADKGDGNEGPGRTEWSKVSLDSYVQMGRQIARQKQKEEEIQLRKTQELQNQIRERTAAYEGTDTRVYPEFLHNLKELGNLLGDSLDNFVYNHERGREIIAQRLAEVQGAKDRDAEMKERTIALMLSYIRRIDEEIRKIDNSTIVELNGRRESLMRIERTKLKEDAVYHPEADAFLKDILRRRKECSDPKKIKSICTSISAADLFHSIYHSVTTKISVIKPEQNQSVYRYHRWNDIAASQSGAERLFASSVPLCAILYYQRNGAIVRRGAAQKWTTLYLDNLFGAIQAEFIIDPLFKLFEATNTQIVTFTYVKDYAVIKNFKNIKLMKTISHKGGKEILALEDRSAPGSAETVEMYGDDIRVVPTEQIESAK